MISKTTFSRLLIAPAILILSITGPLISCGRSGTGSAPGEGNGIYTVSHLSTAGRDSLNNSISGARRNAITTAVAKASPAGVGINVTAEIERRVYDPFEDFYRMDPMLRQFFQRQGMGGGVQKIPVAALGSGFIISADGYVLTNDHVAGNAAKIIVTTTDGSEYDAKLVGTDKTSDISLLKIEGKNLPYLKLGNSDDLAVGEWAIAMGNPFGLFDINDKPTVTVGVISNTGVNLGLEGGRNYRGMIQTDAAISSGNSGGPLLNANGEVIGINAVIRSTATNGGEAGSIGLGFAIPVNKVKDIVGKLRGGDKIDHNIGDLGFHVSDLNEEAKQYFNITSNYGVVITDLYKNSLGAKAGLEPGDLITGIDGDRLRRSDEMESILAEHVAGDVVTLHIKRSTKKMDIRLQLGKT